MLNSVLIRLFFLLIISSVFLSGSTPLYSQQKTRHIVLGAYYFDGWTGTYPYHITPALKKEYKNREPKWGWITSSQSVMNEQIRLAADAGLSFFNFCWYNANGKAHEPLNNALDYFIKSPDKKHLKFSLLIANHKGHEIGPKDWSAHITTWVGYMKDPSYLRINGSPYLSFFSFKTLLQHFGSSNAVKAAISQLRALARENKVPNPLVAVCVDNSLEQVRLAEQCGFDILTGYNYHHTGLRSAGTKTVPLSTLVNAEKKEWNGIADLSKLPYVPVATLNWDPRPWASPDNSYASDPYYTGFSPASVYRSVSSLINWLDRQEMPGDKKIGLLYAWNEYGEGAWLTPSRANDKCLLCGVKQAVRKGK